MHSNAMTTRPCFSEHLRRIASVLVASRGQRPGPRRWDRSKERHSQTRRDTSNETSMGDCWARPGSEGFLWLLSFFFFFLIRRRRHVFSVLKFCCFTSVRFRQAMQSRLTYLSKSGVAVTTDDKPAEDSKGEGRIITGLVAVNTLFDCDLS